MFPLKLTLRGGVMTAACAALALGLAGCSQNQETPPAATSTTTVTTPAAGTATTSTTTAAPGGATASDTTKVNTNAGPGASTGTDTALSDSVLHAIETNKQMTGARVEPVANAGVVTLTGTVQNQQQKALAEKTASGVSGVTSVKNKLTIQSTGGAKSAASHTTKTKVIVVHDKSAPSASGAAGGAAAGGNAAGTAGANVGNTAGANGSADTTAGDGSGSASSSSSPSSGNAPSAGTGQ